jgi:prephenate dehydrogenase
MKKIAIIGLGQIGGSILLSLRKNHANVHITGIETSQKRLRLIRPHLDEATTKWTATRNSDLVIVCLHYEQTVEFLNSAGRDQLITDVCSGKSKVLQIANRRRLRFVGGHPIAGNEFEGEKGWRDHLFAGVPYFLTPGKYAGKRDVAALKRFARSLGARPKIVDARLHDRFVAYTSHFPAFLSILIKELATNIPPQFCGPGFQSITRLAKTQPALLDSFLQSNRPNIIHTSERFQRCLDQFISNAKAQRHKA